MNAFTLTRTPRTTRAFQFTKAGTVHASSADIENASASALAGLPAGATFVTLATDSGLEHLLVTSDSASQESVAFAIARAIAATSSEVDEVPLLTSANVARLDAVSGAEPLQDTQAGADFTALSRIIGDLLLPGEWFAISTRKPHTRTELRRNRTWLDFYGQRTHHSRKTGAVVASFFAGSNTGSGRAADLVSRIAAAIPGFGIAAEPRTISTRSQVLTLVASGVLLGTLSVVAPQLHSVVPEWVPFAGCAAGVALVALAVLTALGRIPSYARSVRERLRFGQLPVPPSRVKPPRAPRKATTQRRAAGRDEMGRQVMQEVVVPERAGDYPLASSSFLVGPHIPLAVVAPHAGSASGVQSTATRVAPPAMAERIGPELGVSGDRTTHLSVADAWAGIGIIGQAGSGKTKLMEHLWGHAARERVSPSGTPGEPTRHALIAFDTKGDGLAAREYAAWSRAAGDKALAIEVFDPASAFGIELFPDRGEGARAWGRSVADALRYIWGEESIGAQSFDTLTRVFAASKVITPAIAARVTARTLPANASPFYLANVLLTNEGDDLAVELAAALAEAAARDDATDELVDTVTGLAPLFGAGRTPSQRQQLVSAPRTKVAALMAAEQWWTRPKRLTWKTALERDLAIIVNTGAGSSGQLPDNKLRLDISGLLLFTLAEEIKRTCIGWFEQGRAVSVFSDEVKHIAAASADVITWMRHDARANGVRACFATQTPDTLVDAVRQTMLGFGTLVLFAQQDPKTVRELVADLELAGGAWTTADVVNLPRFSAIVRATVGGVRQEPFTVSVPDFASRRGAVS